MRHLFTFLLLTGLCISSLSAQNRLFSAPPRDTAPFNNRFYKQELGVGVNGVFGGSVGSALVWKIRDDRSKLVPVSYSHYWRFQAGTSGYTFTGYEDSIYYQVLNRFYYQHPAYSDTYLWFTLGRERNNFQNRFNFYYGWDAGPNFRRTRQTSYQGVFQVYDPATGITRYARVEDESTFFEIGLNAGAFLGVKYHLTKRVSLSFEANAGLYYTLGRNSLVLKIDAEASEPEKSTYHRFGHYLNYLRFITLNYHFKQY